MIDLDYGDGSPSTTNGDHRQFGLPP